MSSSILGNAVKRSEDPRFLTGRGRYIPNLEPRSALHLVGVRAGIPHGRLLGIDTAEAAHMPGVVAVFTAADLDVGKVAPGAPGVSRDLARPPLARDVVRFSGEVVAVVVAETHAQAVDAADLVWPDIEPLPTVATVEQALAEDAPLLFPETGTNVVLRADPPDGPDVLAGADVVVVGEFVNQRLAAIPLEPNAALAVPEGDRLTVYVGTQNVFTHRVNVARSLGLEVGQVHGIAPDIGGGFGAKFYAYPEQVLTAAAAHRLGRPVRWQETRRDNLAGMTQGRAQRQRIELGATADGRLVGMRVGVYQDAGAYPVFGAYLPSWTGLMASGVYDVPAVEYRFRSVVTNTVPIHAYRGAGRPEATAMVERAMDLLAAELGMDPVELRRRNLLRTEAFPVATATGATYDSGDYEAALDTALELAGYELLRADQAARREAGDRVQLGIGVSTYVEITAPLGTEEWAAAEVHENGSVTVRCGTSGHGQGHETAYAQIVAGLLNVPQDSVRVVEGDTDLVPRGGGTGGSRSLQLGGSAVLRAGEAVVEKARRIVARHLEAHLDDVVVLPEGGVGVVGVPDSALTWSEVATLAAGAENLPEGVEPGLAAETDFDQGHATFPFGAHVSVVEVDTETGAAHVVRHIAVDDCGTVLNPLLVAGQVHGGVAQGIGQALYEQVVYDEDGYPQTGNLTTYLIPTATSVPSIEMGHMETPTPHNPLGVKGIGESGTIGSTAAVQNAVVDAVAHLGVKHLDMPATPGRLWEAINRTVS